LIGIVQRVIYYPADPLGIGIHPGQVGLDRLGNSDVLTLALDAALQVGQGLVDQLFQVERLEGKHYPTGFDLADIQQIIDQHSQTFSVGFDHLQEVNLLFGQLAGGTHQQDFHIAFYGSHGRAQFMAYCGNKLGFQAIHFHLVGDILED